MFLAVNTYKNRKIGKDMMDIEAYKAKCGISSSRYVEGWLKEDLIPGVRSGPSLEDFYFPDSARRPYRYRGKIKPNTDASSIRAHIVNACIRREHITKEMCFATQGEFGGFIEDLVSCGLISVRVEDNITYYDSTSRSDLYEGKKFSAIKKFVLDALEAVTEGITEGSINALNDSQCAVLV